MKGFAAAFVVILTTAPIFNPVPAFPDTLYTISCCYSFANKRILLRAIKRYIFTSSSCPQPGIIFVIRKKRQVCANPEKKWVQDHVKFLEARRQHDYEVKQKRKPSEVEEGRRPRPPAGHCKVCSQSAPGRDDWTC